jgi:hypothetical protein
MPSIIANFYIVISNTFQATRTDYALHKEIQTEYIKD